GTQERVQEAIRTWHATFADRVDPTELALRSAGVVLSLATGPHRQQETAWEAATEAIIRVAEPWVEVARTAESRRSAPQDSSPAASGPSGQPGPAGPSGPAGPAGGPAPTAPSAPTHGPSHGPADADPRPAPQPPSTGQRPAQPPPG